MYLDAGVAGLGLGLYADVAAAVLPALPLRAGPRVPALVRDHGGDRVRRVGLDEEAVQGGRRALRDGGGLVRRVGLVRVAAVDHSALRDVDAGSAAHRSALCPEERISAAPRTVPRTSRLPGRYHAAVHPVHWPVVASLGSAHRPPPVPSVRVKEKRRGDPCSSSRGFTRDA